MKVMHKLLNVNVLYMYLGLKNVNILPFNQEILCLHSTFKKWEYSSAGSEHPDVLVFEENMRVGRVRGSNYILI